MAASSITPTLVTAGITLGTALVTAVIGFTLGTWSDLFKLKNAYRQRLNEERLKAMQELIDLVIEHHQTIVLGNYLYLPFWGMKLMRLQPFLSATLFTAVADYLQAMQAILDEHQATGHDQVAIATDGRIIYTIHHFLNICRDTFISTVRHGCADAELSSQDIQHVYDHFNAALAARVSALPEGAPASHGDIAGK